MRVIISLQRLKSGMEVHWNGIQVAASNSWIGIEGLPLNLWNEKTFNSIGEECVGLLEVVEETRNLTSLSFSKLKVKGFPHGFLNPLLQIPIEDVIVHVRIFSLEDRFAGGWCTRRTLAIRARAGPTGKPVMGQTTVISRAEISKSSGISDNQDYEKET